MAYSYEGLGTHRNIRILLLAPSVDHSSPLCFTFEEIDIINADDQYEAISYAWGEPLFSHRIYQNDDLDQFLRITKSLHDALTRFRHPIMTRRLWADAICINQADDAEKALQIPLMRQIYQRASKVLVWLGEGSAESSAIFDHISRISRQSSPEVDDIQEETRQAVSSFLNNPYFSRRWIVQEMALNLDVSLFCGEREMTWVRLCTALDKLRLGDKQKDHAVGHGRLEQIHHLWKYWTFDGSSDQETEMLSLLNNLDHCLCSDERDVIYAICGLASDVDLIANSNSGMVDPALTHQKARSKRKSTPKKSDVSGLYKFRIPREFYDDRLENSPISINIDYSQSTATVYTNFAKSAIISGSGFHIISAACNRKKLPSHLQALDIPSWVPDWRIPAYNSLNVSNSQKNLDQLIFAPSRGENRPEANMVKVSIKSIPVENIHMSHVFCKSVVSLDSDSDNYVAEMWAEATGCTRRFDPQDPDDQSFTRSWLVEQVKEYGLNARMMKKWLKHHCGLYAGSGKRGAKVGGSDNVTPELEGCYWAFATHNYKSCSNQRPNQRISVWYPEDGEARYTYFGLTTCNIQPEDRLIFIPKTYFYVRDGDQPQSNFSTIILRPLKNGNYGVIGGAVVIPFTCHCQGDKRSCTFDGRDSTDDALNATWGITEVTLE